MCVCVCARVCVYVCACVRGYVYGRAQMCFSCAYMWICAGGSDIFILLHFVLLCYINVTY